jgi:hypothetical protein
MELLNQFSMFSLAFPTSLPAASTRVIKERRLTSVSSGLVAIAVRNGVRGLSEAPGAGADGSVVAGGGVADAPSGDVIFTTNCAGLVGAREPTVAPVAPDVG